MQTLILTLLVQPGRQFRQVVWAIGPQVYYVTQETPHGGATTLLTLVQPRQEQVRWNVSCIQSYAAFQHAHSLLAAVRLAVGQDASLLSMFRTLGHNACRRYGQSVLEAQYVTIYFIRPRYRFTMCYSVSKIMTLYVKNNKICVKISCVSKFTVWRPPYIIMIFGVA